MAIRTFISDSGVEAEFGVVGVAFVHEMDGVEGREQFGVSASTGRIA